MVKNIITYFLFLTVNVVFAQQEDVGLWTGLKLSQEITKKTSISYTQGLRFDNNISNISNSFSQLKGSYELSKSFKISGAYRWARKQNWQEELNIDNRYQFDLRYKKKFDDFGIKNRIRFQSKYTNFATSDYGYVPDNQLRNKLTFDYKINKKLKPHFSFEFFYPLNSYENLITKIRYQIGADYKLSKMISVNIFTIYQQEFNKINPLNSMIFGSSISIELSTLAKKKNDKKDNSNDVKEK